MVGGGPLTHPAPQTVEGAAWLLIKAHMSPRRQQSRLLQDKASRRRSCLASLTHARTLWLHNKAFRSIISSSLPVDHLGSSSNCFTCTPTYLPHHILHQTHRTNANRLTNNPAFLQMRPSVVSLPAPGTTALIPKPWVSNKPRHSSWGEQKAKKVASVSMWTVPLSDHH